MVTSSTTDPRPSVEACKPFGAPLVFVCFEDTLQWWKQRTTSAEWLESIPVEKIDKFFERHLDEFAPQAVYRAKTWGRFRSQYQLTFVDLGLMPLVEEEVGQALGRLIEHNVSELRRRLGWRDISNSQGHWLLKATFWLVSAKILRDKQVVSFQELDLSDVEEVFHRVATHYGTQPFEVDSTEKTEALKESALEIDRFSSLSLTTTEALAYVYENTLISKQTRLSLGTHRTPSFLVDYVVGNLADWIEEIPLNDRSVFELACGHAAFLVSAMRLLTELLPVEEATPVRRGQYLRSRLHGTDIDAFALELARLSLTLTDIPNPDGWDLHAEDMFLGKRLSEQARRNTILLANPPFDNFTPKRRAEYKKQGVEIGVINKTAEILRRTVPELQPGGVFGFVIPQTVLHSAYGEEVRKLLVETCELREITLFPDKVFSFSDAESAILLGRRLRSGSKSRPQIRYQRVREPQMPGFRARYEASTTKTVPQSRFSEATRWSLRIPDLEDIWEALREAQRITAVAELGLGLVYHGRDLPAGTPTYSETRFPGAQRGFIRFGRGVSLHGLPTSYWMSLAKKAILWKRAGTTAGIPQVLLNYARVSRGPWRLKALIDHKGHPVASAFITIRPISCTLELLWALLNAPVANAYAFTHLGKRHNIISDIRQIPLPASAAFKDIESAAKAYLEAAAANAQPAVLQALMQQVDVEVLKGYSLPVELERDLLDLFAGYQRVGVPFTQTSYFPEQLKHPMRLSDFLSFSKDWKMTNRERTELISKNIAKTISLDEQTRLDALQAYADYHLAKMAPRPNEILDEIEARIFSRREEQEQHQA